MDRRLVELDGIGVGLAMLEAWVDDGSHGHIDFGGSLVRKRIVVVDEQQQPSGGRDLGHRRNWLYRQVEFEVVLRLSAGSALVFFLLVPCGRREIGVRWSLCGWLALHS